MHILEAVYCLLFVGNYVYVFRDYFLDHCIMFGISTLIVFCLDGQFELFYQN